MTAEEYKDAVELAHEEIEYHGKLRHEPRLKALAEAVLWANKMIKAQDTAGAEQEKELAEFKAGVQNFRCPNCKEIAGPFYPVNLVNELKERDGLLLEAKKILKLVQSMAGNPDAAEGCRNIIRVVDICLGKHNAQPREES